MKDIGHLVLSRLVIALACVALVVWQVPIVAAVAHVQTINTDDAAASSTTLTSGSITLTGGNLLLAAVASGLAGGTVTDVTTVQLDGSTSFTKAGQATDGTNELVAIFYLPSVASGSHTTTATFNAASTYDAIFLTEVSGAATSSVLDGTCATASGSSTTPASGSFTTIGTSFIYGALVAGVPNTITQGSGWTIPTNGTNATAAGAVEYKANPGTTSHTADFTISNTDWAAIGCAFKVVGAATTKPPCLLLGLSC